MLSQPYIAIEGLNGAGKSTLRDELYSIFSERGKEAFLFGQHGWLDPAATRLVLDCRTRRRFHAPEAVLAAHLADRVASDNRIIRRTLSHSPIIGDRSVVSDLAYMRCMGGPSVRDAMSTYTAHGVLFPDAVVFVSIPVAKALERVQARGEIRKAYETEADLRSVDEDYRTALALLPCPTVEIPWTTSKDEASRTLRQLVESLEQR
jgi:dTMP kinase